MNKHSKHYKELTNIIYIYIYVDLSMLSMTMPHEYCEIYMSSEE